MSLSLHDGFQGGAIYVDSSKLDVKGSNFIQNKVGHELVNKDGKNCTSGNFPIQLIFFVRPEKIHIK